MSSIENDDGGTQQLFTGVEDGNSDVVKAALEAGVSVNVNGHPERPYAPIVAATMAGHAGIVHFLLERGADPDSPVTDDLPCSCSDIAAAISVTEELSCSCSDNADAMYGERSLHIAARSGKVEIVRLLLKRSLRADPNATDDYGRTPLMATCKSPRVCVEVVQLLLEAGADPALAQEEGLIPLQAVALNGYMDLVDMLHTGAPTTLNRCTSRGETPLSMACSKGHESMVFKLLSLGATQRMPSNELGIFPVTRAVSKGFVGVVQVLIDEGGIRAIGGKVALGQALGMAVRVRQARILRLLLTVDGEEKRSEWANTDFGSTRLLHYGVAY